MSWHIKGARPPPPVLSWTEKKIQDFPLYVASHCSSHTLNKNRKSGMACDAGSGTCGLKCRLVKGKTTGHTQIIVGRKTFPNELQWLILTYQGNRCKKQSQQPTTDLLRTGVADGYNLPPVPLMIATRGQVLHSVDKNTLIRWQALGSHRNTMEQLNETACTKEHRLKQTCCALVISKIFPTTTI